MLTATRRVTGQLLAQRWALSWALSSSSPLLSTSLAPNADHLAPSYLKGDAVSRVTDGDFIIMLLMPDSTSMPINNRPQSDVSCRASIFSRAPCWRHACMYVLLRKSTAKPIEGQRAQSNLIFCSTH